MDLKLRNRTKEATVDGEGEDVDRTRKNGAVVIKSDGQSWQSHAENRLKLADCINGNSWK